MKKIALVLALACAGCIPLGSPNVVAPVATPTPPSAGDRVTVTVVNAFAGTGIYATVLQFCGRQNAHGPMQPYNVHLGRAGATSRPPAINRITGNPSSCFNGPAKSVIIAFNAADWLVNCRAVITPRRHGCM